MYRREDIDRVRAATNLIELVGGVTTIKRQGRAHKAVCPFHQEKTPSLSLEPARGLYYCFGCQESGDVFTFVEKTQGLDFNEAVEFLARQAGITLTVDEAAARRRGEHERLVEAVRAAIDFYHRRLRNGEDAGVARRYLRSRGYDAAVVDTYKLGYSPGDDSWDALARELRSAGHKDQTLIDAGLARRGRGGRLIDQFRGRLMFPIWDLRGDPVGFGARILGPGTPKYINSPDSRIYQKSRLLYGLERAKSAIARRGVAVIVEGYTDVIACHQAGVETAVATCGTALGDDHFDLLRRFSEKVVLAFDADEAGAGAALRSDQLETPVRLDLDLRVAVMPEGQDPADLVQGGRTADLERAVEEAKPFLQFLLEREVTHFDLAEPEGRARALHATGPLVARVGDDIARHEYVRYLSFLTGVDLPTVERAVNPRSTGTKAAAAPRQDPVGDRMEREALRVILANPPVLEKMEVDPGWFSGDELRSLVEAILQQREKATAGSSIDISLITDDPVRAAMLAQIALDPRPLPGDPAEPLERIRVRALDQQTADLRRRLEHLDPGSDQYDEALRRLIELEREKRPG
jgi:DNA primase